MKQQSTARSTNYMFVFGEDRSTTYAVQNAQTPDMTLGETIYGSQPKDLFIPSNKVETSPIVIQFLIDEDLDVWIKMVKWMYAIKNANQMQMPDLVKTCELATLDGNNQTTNRIVYMDCFPTNISSIQYATTDASNALTFDMTLRYNEFKIITKSGEIIDETYRG